MLSGHTYLQIWLILWLKSVYFVFPWCTIGIMHTIRIVPPSNLWGKCVFPEWLESAWWRLLAVTGWNLLQKGYCTKNVLWLGTQTRNIEHCNPKIKDVPYYCTGTKIFQKAQLSFWMQMVFDSCHIFPTFTAAWRLASQSVLKSSSPFKIQTTMSICKRPKQLQGGFCCKTAYVFATSFT